MEVWMQRVMCKVSDALGSMNATGPEQSNASRDPLRSYFHEPQNNEIYFLIEFIFKN